LAYYYALIYHHIVSPPVISTLIDLTCCLAPETVTDDSDEAIYQLLNLSSVHHKIH